MEKTIVKFGDTKIEKHKFHHYKRPTSKKEIDINKTFVSNKVYFDKKGFQCLIGYKDAKNLDLYAYFFQ